MSDNHSEVRCSVFPADEQQEVAWKQQTQNQNHRLFWCRSSCWHVSFRVQYTDYVRYVEPCFKGTLVQADLDNREVRPLSSSWGLNGRTRSHTDQPLDLHPGSQPVAQTWGNVIGHLSTNWLTPTHANFNEGLSISLSVRFRFENLSRSGSQPKMNPINPGVIPKLHAKTLGVMFITNTYGRKHNLLRLFEWRKLWQILHKLCWL